MKVESAAEIVLAVPANASNEDVERAIERGVIDEVLLHLKEWKDVAGGTTVEKLGHYGVQDLNEDDREPHIVLWRDEE